MEQDQLELLGGTEIDVLRNVLEGFRTSYERMLDESSKNPHIYSLANELNDFYNSIHRYSSNNVPSESTVSKEIYLGKVQRMALDKFIVEIGSPRRITKLFNSQKFRRQFFQEERVEQIKIRAELIGGISLFPEIHEHLGLAFTEKARPESYTPDMNLDDYLSNHPEPYFLPIFSSDVLLNDFKFISEKFKNIDDNNPIVDFFQTITSVPDNVDKANKIFIFNQALDFILDTEGKAKYKITKAALKLPETGLSLKWWNDLYKEIQFDENFDKYIRGSGRLSLRIINLLISVQVVRFQWNNEDFNHANFAASLAYLGKEVGDFSLYAKGFMVGEKINPYKWFTKFNLFLDYVVGPIYIVIDIRSAGNEFMVGNKRAGFAGLAMAAAGAAPWLYSLGIATAFAANFFIPILFVGIAIYITFFMDTDKKIRLTSFLRRNEFSRNPENLFGILPLEIGFTFIPKFWENGKMIFSDSVKHSTARQLVRLRGQLNSIGLSHSHGWTNNDLTFNFENPQIPFSDFIVILRFYDHRGIDVTGFWRIDSEVNTESYEKYIIPINIKEKNTPSWWEKNKHIKDISVETSESTDKGHRINSFEFVFIFPAIAMIGDNTNHKRDLHYKYYEILLLPTDMSLFKSQNDLMKLKYEDLTWGYSYINKIYWI